MKVKLQKATVTAINIKEAIKLTIEIDEISADDLVELCKLRNTDVSLTFSNTQTQLPNEEVKTVLDEKAAERLKQAAAELRSEEETPKVEVQAWE